jgi:hypothetical protein
MHRRRVLSGAVTIAAATIAGCTSSPGWGAATDGDEHADSTTTPTTTRSVAATLTPQRSCPNPGGATVALNSDSVSVVGCVVGKNGCMRPHLMSVDRDRDAGEVTVVVAAEERAPVEGCTAALVSLGYKARIDYDDPPSSVTVVHHDVGGRRTVAAVTR